MKTSEQMAEEWGNVQPLVSFDGQDREQVKVAYECNRQNHAKSYLAGYKAAKTEESYIEIQKPQGEVLRIVPTPGGFDIKIAEGVTPTEAAMTFIESVKEILQQQGLWQALPEAEEKCGLVGTKLFE